MARIVKYQLKNTRANTQYITITPEDLIWLQSQMIEWLVVMGQMATQKNNGLVIWWTQATNRLNPGRRGVNSPLTTTSGILDNFLFKQEPQKDLSVKQLDDIERISFRLNQHLDPTRSIEAILFQLQDQGKP